MQMKLINPKQVRDQLARRYDALSLADVARELDMHPHTIRKLFRGGTVSDDTIRNLAAKLDTKPLDIAEFVD